MAATDGKLQCTVGLAIPMEFGMPWYSHIILKDTTSRSWSSAWPDNMLCASTVTHWQIMESLLEFVTLLNNKLTGQRSGPDPWVFLIDVASVHIAYAFRSVHPKHTHLCCIHRGSTSVAQSADIGVTKPFKDAMATACGDSFATTLLDPLRASETVVLSDSLAQNTIHMPTWVTEAVLPLQSREKIHLDGWKHIVTHVLDTARKHLAAAYVDHFQKETYKARRRTRLPHLS